LTRPILFLYPTLTVGGAERQLALLVPRLRRHGFRPLIATLDSRGRYFDELSDAGIPIVHLGMRSRADVRAIFRSYRLWRITPGIVFTQGVSAQILGQAIAFRAGAAHVTAEHGGAGFQRGLHRTFLARLVAQTVDRVVCVSETQVPDLRRLGYRGSSIRVIPNGIPDPRPTPPASETRLQLGLEDDDIVLLLVATLRPEKRADLFVDAVARANATDTRIRGLVVGGGPQLAQVHAQAQAFGGVVRVIGERSDVPALMTCADAICLSSDLEAVPMTLLEAMAAGRPIIATSVGGVTEIVIPSETGWLVPPSDPRSFAEAILELAADPKRRRAMGEKARARFEREYGVELMVGRYAELLSEVSQGGEGTQHLVGAGD
jgi:glycosyltransferase involved in cell wall biosynthesis